jgi:hypothetical protein
MAKLQITIGENRIGQFNSKNERRVWVAAFERACKTIGPRARHAHAFELADAAVMSFRLRAINADSFAPLNPATLNPQ